MAYTTIDDPSAYFQIALYNGNAGTQSITNDGASNLQPDMVWIKCRSGTHATENHNLFDSVRGVNKFAITNGTTAANSTDTNSLTAFNSDGFSLGTRTDVNGSGAYVGWQWKESATAGFDIVSFTGNSSDGATTQDISHSLSAVPHWIIVKNGADSTNWAVYHKANTSSPETEVIYLNLTNATADDNAFFGDTAPTSSQFRVGGDNSVNGNSDSMIAYLWSEKQGFSKFGSYTGNGNANGPFVYTGFKPAWVMAKRTGTSGQNWEIHDNKRPEYNSSSKRLWANLSNAEATEDPYLDLVSNGFKIKTSDTNYNASDSYIYMAFAESPFVNSNGIPNNAR